MHKESKPKGVGMPPPSLPTIERKDARGITLLRALRSPNSPILKREVEKFEAKEKAKRDAVVAARRESLRRHKAKQAKGQK